MSSEGFSALEKNAVICPHRIVLIKCPFGAFFKKELAGSGVAARCSSNRSAEFISFQRARRP
jgi:hypothetical protein